MNPSSNPIKFLKKAEEHSSYFTVERVLFISDVIHALVSGSSTFCHMNEYEHGHFCHRMQFRHRLFEYQDIFPSATVLLPDFTSSQLWLEAVWSPVSASLHSAGIPD